MEPINPNRGGEVRVYESSAADGPHIWLNVKEPADPVLGEAHAHLTLEQAKLLRDQLDYLIGNHYQT
jgi:hypothetical protein